MLLSDKHKDWIREAIENQWQSSLSPLLNLRSNGGEPRWLVFCDYLARAFDSHHEDILTKELNQLAHQLWGPNCLTREELSNEWFSVEGRSPSHRIRCADQGVIDRALAVAVFAGQRYQRNDSQVCADGLLRSEERAALSEYLVQGYMPDPKVSMQVMLVNESVAPGEQGRRAQLRLTPIRVPVDQHGQLFRAPAAVLLNLRTPGNTTFEDGLGKVETLLRACLEQPDAEGGTGLLWSLHPEPMVLDHGNQLKLHDWSTRAITGASATGAFALASLWVLREQLDETLEGMTLARQQLRDIQPSQMTISAQLLGDEPPNLLKPLDWTWDVVSGLDEKLGSFVRDRKLLSANEDPVTLALLSTKEAPVSLALVAKSQGYNGFKFRPEPVETIAAALDAAHRKIGSPLPEEAEALRRHLLDVHFGQPRDVDGRPIEEAQPRTPVAPEALILPLRSETLRSNSQAINGPNRPEDVGKPNAIAWYLLRAYARWAGGDHLLWGEPARLAEDFYPIKLETEVSGEDRQRRAGGQQGARDVTARSLIELLDSNFLPKQPPVWVLAAAPAAGKTTMMAEFQMYHAFKALRQYALSGHFGVVPLWIPARELVLRDSTSDHDRTLDQAIEAWLQSNWPSLGTMRLLLANPYARVQVLLDGVNELRCSSDMRESLLTDWLAANFGLAHSHRPPLLTVRSLELIRPQDAQVAHLQPWDRRQRDEYVRQRLEENSEHLRAMLSALDADEKASGADPQKMLFGSPGMLSLACTLMLKGLLPADPEQRPMSRARLLSTLIWSRLEAEDQSHNRTIPSILLGREEKARLRALSDYLHKGDWYPPVKPGPLLSALAEQARRMQFDSSSVDIELPEDEWWSGTEDEKEREALTSAASHLGVVENRRGKDKNERVRDWLSFRHQLLLEFFSTYALAPDGPWPAGVAAPKMTRIENDYRVWYGRRRGFGRKEMVQHRSQGEQEFENGRLDRFLYQVPAAEISIFEEPFKLAAQLRGNVVDWVSRLIDVGNAPLAARIALENWTVFGEPAYPKEDPLGPWRVERKKHEKTGGTDPVLNKLRKALFDRMEDQSTHLASRLEAGSLLGSVGGSPLFRICGDALILKDEYWVLIGEEGKYLTYEMGDLRGESDEQTVDGRLYDVLYLPAFRMAGYLVTNAQYRCFAASAQYRSSDWWPGAAKEWLEAMNRLEKPWLNSRESRKYIMDRGLTSAVEMAWTILGDADFPGLEPFVGNFWQVQAYALWEQAQRKDAGWDAEGWSVCLPTEAHWECGARWATLSQKCDSAHLGDSEAPRWRFAHTAGDKKRSDKVSDVRIVEYLEQMEGVRFVDISPWDFNHRTILGSHPSPVGVFVECNARNPKWPKEWAIRDLAGNVWEWCSSRYDTQEGQAKLGYQVEWEAVGLELRAQRGGSFESTPTFCTLSSRVGEAPRVIDGTTGFRMIMQKTA